MRKVHLMLEMAEVGTGDVVYDLGCGDVRTLVSAARRYAAARWVLRSTLCAISGARR